MCRIDRFHEADCPHLLDFESGFAVLTGLLEESVTLCDRCDPILWWDVLPGNVTRFELRHADDCCAESATAGMVSVSMT